MSKCLICEKEVVPIEMSLTRKLINRSADRFLCKKCLAQRFSCSESKLDEMAEQFKKQGCSLFTD